MPDSPNIFVARWIHWRFDKPVLGLTFRPVPAPIFIANADCIVIDRSPLVLEPGMRLKVGPSDQVWIGWVAVVAEDGRFTYIPASRIRVEADGSAMVTEQFDATDLSVRQGEKIVSLAEVDGWHWARGPQGEEGWLPGYVLYPA